MLWIVGIAAEIVMFHAAHRLLSILGPRRLIALSSLMTTVRWFILGSTNYVPFVILGQTLQCFTIAANNSAVMDFISKHVDESSRTSAISIYVLTAMGVLISFVTQLDTRLSSTIGIDGFYVMAAVSLCAIPVLGLSSCAIFTTKGSKV
jgi:PPP family 3-phenylpropionic acid transporter